MGTQTALVDIAAPPLVRSSQDRLAVLRGLLAGELDFHRQNSGYASHNFHAFAAKFPPQLPALFIDALTEPGDTVLDPMMGSGTAIVEAALAGRRAIGFDIDPLAVRLCRVKTTPIADLSLLERLAQNVVACALELLGTPEVERALERHFDGKSRAFVGYWFLPATQREIMALLLAIDLVTTPLADDLQRGHVKDFFLVTLSAIIITKSGGVTMARDLAHSRPHLVKDKTPKSAVEQFRLKARSSIRSLGGLTRLEAGAARVCEGDARNLRGLQEDASVRLVITSPPYANAIDYMRAHKFSLAWLGMPISDLTERRATYIGSERIRDTSAHIALPADVESVVSAVADLDRKQSAVLRKYFLEMGLVLAEMHRVLAPGGAAVIVVGSSTMRGVTVPTGAALASIAAALPKPFVVAGIGERALDRDRRMMPARWGAPGASMIEQRMHVEQVLGLHKQA